MAGSSESMMSAVIETDGIWREFSHCAAAVLNDAPVVFQLTTRPKLQNKKKTERTRFIGRLMPSVMKLIFLIFFLNLNRWATARLTRPEEKMRIWLDKKILKRKREEDVLQYEQVAAALRGVARQGPRGAEPVPAGVGQPAAGQRARPAARSRAPAPAQPARGGRLRVAVALPVAGQRRRRRHRTPQAAFHRPVRLDGLLARLPRYHSLFSYWSSATSTFKLGALTARVTCDRQRAPTLKPIWSIEREI